MKSKSMVRLVLSLLLCLAVGTLEGLVTRPEIPTWYPDWRSHPGRRRRRHFQSPGPFSMF